mgnify:CR=1 FL=1
MNYGFTITEAGLDLLAHSLSGSSVAVTRVVFGSGKVPAEVNPAGLEDLINPVAQGTSSTPIPLENTYSFVAEYRNDLNGGLQEGFWINEFGIFASNPEYNDGVEVLLYYATLGDNPQYVSPITAGGIDVRRFPVSIAVTNDVNITLTYPAAAFVTEPQMVTFIGQHLMPEILTMKGDIEELQKRYDRVQIHKDTDQMMDNLGDTGVTRIFTWFNDAEHGITGDELRFCFNVSGGPGEIKIAIADTDVESIINVPLPPGGDLYLERVFFAALPVNSLAPGAFGILISLRSLEPGNSVVVYSWECNMVRK